MLGALGFGWLTDRIGRKKLFFITLALYLTATAATALSWNVASYALFRFLTGAGIGGEYTAINSTIQELVPARYRGWTDLVINGSFWIGAAIGAVSAIVLLDPHLHRPRSRLAAGLFHRRLSRPRGVRDADVDSGKPALADDSRPSRPGARDRRRYRAIGDRARAGPARQHAWPKIKLRMRDHTPLREVAHTLFSLYRQRSLVGLALMTAQAFFYNAIFFTFALVLTDFYGIAAEPGRLVHPAVRGRQFPRAAAARPAVRHAGPPRHDRVHLWRFRRAAGAVGLSVLDRRAERRRPRPSPGW